jgi:hypothetical protein
MKLKVKLNPLVEASIKLIPSKVEAPNHQTLMAVVDAFIEENPDKEVLYNCAKVNRKRIDKDNVIPAKWTAQIYAIETGLLEDLFVRQNPRSFEISFKPLKEIVYKPKTQRKPKLVQEKVEISNSAETTQSALV